DEGLRVLNALLEQTGMGLPPSPTAALASLLWHRAQLRLRGSGFDERNEEALAHDELDRIDLCWCVGNGLGGVDLVRSADFQARPLLLALRAGEPYRIARALAWESILSALEGGAGIKRAGRLAQSAEELAERIAHPHALGWAVSASAVTAWCEA